MTQRFAKLLVYFEQIPSCPDVRCGPLDSRSTLTRGVQLSRAWFLECRQFGTGPGYESVDSSVFFQLMSLIVFESASIKFVWPNETNLSRFKISKICNNLKYCLFKMQYLNKLNKNYLQQSFQITV